MNRNLKKGLAAFLIINSVVTTSSLSIFGGNVFAVENNKSNYAIESREYKSKNYNTIIDQCVNNGLNNLITKDSGVWYSKEFGDWEALTVSSFNKEIPQSYIKNLTEKIQNRDGSLFGEDGKFKSVTDCERVIIGVVSAGQDPRNIGGYNLIEDLCTRDLKKEKNIFAQMFGLIALDCGNFELTQNSLFSKDDLVNRLVKKQLPTGGWSWGSSIDVDTTTMVISALSTYYKDNDKVKDAIDKAIGALSKEQSENGEFVTTWTPNGSSESLAQTIIALCSVGIDPTSSEIFTKNGKNLLDLLLEYKTKDNGFEHDKKNGDVLNGMATEQAFRALSAYKQLKSGKEGSIYLIKNFK